LKNQTIITVKLDDRAYPITIGASILENKFDFDPWIKGKDCLIVTNVNVAPLYLDLLLSNIKNKKVETLILPDGESNKTLHIWSQILDKLVAMKANRDSTVIALGGGVIGDVVGFASASYMRGLPYIQIPTTLLSQVDSSVGGKTGINHSQGKNLIGAFYQPSLVLVDINTLSTLPNRELICGLAEIIKYGAIFDKEFFCWLEKNISNLLNRNSEALVHAISISCSIKAKIVSEDEFETGRRIILNFGHTFAHALENLLGYGKLQHGEAVAIGMILAAKLSPIENDDLERLEHLIKKAQLPCKVDSIDSNEMLEIMLLDKKVRAKQLRLVLLSSLGNAYVEEDISHERILDVINKTLS
tara:strand:- start:22824 stop:23897 length:1074 start_codon:yes stop_codon:yes gene_type:complete